MTLLSIGKGIRWVRSSVVFVLAFLVLFGEASAQTADGPSQRIIVKWKATTQAATRQQSMANMQASFGVRMNALRATAEGAQIMVLDRRMTGDEMKALINRFAGDPAVEYVEEDVLRVPTFTPNDTRYNEQWSYYETLGGINLPASWDISTGTGVRVAVLDTGFRPHADLAGNLLPGYDFISDLFTANDNSLRDSDASDPGNFTSPGQCSNGFDSPTSDWHGTHVAGTVAAVTNNAIGVAGVAFGAKVVPVRVLGRCGGFTSDIADAIIWASGGSVSGVPSNTTPAQVINMSLGGPGPCGTTFQNAINSARLRNTVVVVSAGNDNQNAANFAPANCSGVITVAATNRSGGKASYSNFGATVDIAAPGGDGFDGILSTLNTGLTTPGSDSYEFYQGTSMAAPHVAGVVAVMLSKNSSLTPNDVEAKLKATARPFPATCNQCGAGIVNAFAALDGQVAPKPPLNAAVLIAVVSLLVN